MKFTVADLLDQLLVGESLPLSKLHKALGVNGEEASQQLRIGLDALIKLGLIAEDPDGLQRLENADLVPARLRCSSKGFCFALREDGGDDIYIRDHLLNHAWNGDRVLVKVTREGGRRRSPEGGIQCILERQTPSLLAQVEQQPPHLVATPLDDRLLTSIHLPEADAGYVDPAHDSVVEIQIDRYPVAQFATQGHVARRLPINGGDDADRDLLLTKHRLNSRPVAPRSTLKVPATKDRTDLTSQNPLLLSEWQGKDAPALPAICLEPSENGWTLWVHTPAVAERLSSGSSLDHWLRDQADALCLGRQWMPLLNPSLTKASSFKVGEAQAAVSVRLDLSSEGRLEHYRFCLTQIKPAGIVDGTALNAMVQRKPKSRTTPAALKTLKEHIPQLEQLIALTGELCQRRQDQGAIELDLAMPAIESLGDMSVPSPDSTLAGWMVQLPAHHPMAILREALLLADRALGQHLKALGLPAIYAINPSPEASDLNDVAKAALALDIPLELGEEGHARGAELARAFAATDRSRSLQQQLKAIIKPVMLSYEPGDHALAGIGGEDADGGHGGLSDLVLVLLLSEGKDRPSVRHKIGVDLASDTCHGTIDWPLLPNSALQPFQQAQAQGLVQRLNGKRRFMVELNADLLAMAQARQAEPLVGKVLPGVISGVQSYGFFVEVPPSNVEGLVHVSSLKDDWYEYRSRQNRLVGRKNRRTYMLGDKVEVEIQKVDALRHQIDLGVLMPEGFDDGDEMAEGSDTPSPSADNSGDDPDQFAPVPVLSEA